MFGKKKVYHSKSIREEFQRVYHEQIILGMAFVHSEENKLSFSKEKNTKISLHVYTRLVPLMYVFTK